MDWYPLLFRPIRRLPHACVRACVRKDVQYRIAHCLDSEPTWYFRERAGLCAFTRVSHLRIADDSNETRSTANASNTGNEALTNKSARAAVTFVGPLPRDPIAAAAVAAVAFARGPLIWKGQRS